MIYIIVEWGRLIFVAVHLMHGSKTPCICLMEFLRYWTPILRRVLQNHHCLSVCQFGIFLRNGSLVFSDFWHDARYNLKTDRTLFSRKVHFHLNLGKKGLKWPQNRGFLFSKSLSLVFLGNSLK